MRLLMLRMLNPTGWVTTYPPLPVGLKNGAFAGLLDRAQLTIVAACDVVTRCTHMTSTEPCTVLPGT